MDRRRGQLEFAVLRLFPSLLFAVLQPDFVLVVIGVFVPHWVAMSSRLSFHNYGIFLQAWVETEFDGKDNEFKQPAIEIDARSSVFHAVIVNVCLYNHNHQKCFSMVQPVPGFLFAGYMIDQARTRRALFKSIEIADSMSMNSVTCRFGQPHFNPRGNDLCKGWRQIIQRKISKNEYASALDVLRRFDDRLELVSQQTDSVVKGHALVTIARHLLKSP